MLSQDWIFLTSSRKNVNRWKFKFIPFVLIQFPFTILVPKIYCREELPLFMPHIYLMDWRHGPQMWLTSKMVSWEGQGNCLTFMNWKFRTTYSRLSNHGFDLSLRIQGSSWLILLSNQAGAPPLIHLLLDHPVIWPTTVDYSRSKIHIYIYMYCSKFPISSILSSCRIFSSSPTRDTKCFCCMSIEKFESVLREVTMVSLLKCYQKCVMLVLL